MKLQIVDNNREVKEDTIEYDVDDILLIEFQKSFKSIGNLAVENLIKHLKYSLSNQLLIYDKDLIKVKILKRKKEDE